MAAAEGVPRRSECRLAVDPNYVLSPRHTAPKFDPILSGEHAVTCFGATFADRQNCNCKIGRVRRALFV